MACNGAGGAVDLKSRRQDGATHAPRKTANITFKTRTDRTVTVTVCRQQSHSGATTYQRAGAAAFPGLARHAPAACARGCREAAWRPSLHQPSSAKVARGGILESARRRCRPASPRCTEAAAARNSRAVVSRSCSASSTACRRCIHLTRVGSRPSRAIQLKQRYTVYSYTALYTMQPLHHPSAPAAAGRAPPGRRARAGRARGSRASSPRSLPASPKPAAPQTAARRGRRTAPASAPTPAGSRRSS